MERDDAQMAVLTAMEPLNNRKPKYGHKTMAEAGDMSISGRHFPEMQILTVSDMLEGKRFDTPCPKGRSESAQHPLL